MLLDWEVEDEKVSSARSEYGANSTTRVVRANPSYADPDVGEDFKGIERFYPKALLESAENAGELSIQREKNSTVLGVRPKAFNAAKAALRQRVLQSSSLKELGELERLVEQALAATA